MTYTVPLSTILSVIVLCFFALQGDHIEIPAWDLSLKATNTSLTVSFSPTFLVLTERPLLKRGVAGFAFGCVAVVDRQNPVWSIDAVTEHELSHVRQYYALGIILFETLGKLCLNLEGEPCYSFYGCCPRCTRQMWQPTEEWHNLWQFISVTCSF
jgi:hypothetical protein